MDDESKKQEETNKTNNSEAKEEPGCGGLCPCPNCTCGKDCKCAILSSPQCDPCSVFVNEQKTKKQEEGK